MSNSGADGARARRSSRPIASPTNGSTSAGLDELVVEGLIGRPLKFEAATFLSDAEAGRTLQSGFEHMQDAGDFRFSEPGDRVVRSGLSNY